MSAELFFVVWEGWGLNTQGPRVLHAGISLYLRVRRGSGEILGDYSKGSKNPGINSGMRWWRSSALAPNLATRFPNPGDPRAAP